MAKKSKRGNSSRPDKTGLSPEQFAKLWAQHSGGRRGPWPKSRFYQKALRRRVRVASVDSHDVVRVLKSLAFSPAADDVDEVIRLSLALRNQGRSGSGAKAAAKKSAARRPQFCSHGVMGRKCVICDPSVSGWVCAVRGGEIHATPGCETLLQQAAQSARRVAGRPSAVRALRGDSAENVASSGRCRVCFEGAGSQSEADGSNSRELQQKLARRLRASGNKGVDNWWVGGE